MTTLTYTEIEEKYPEAWMALPEPYRNDSCLEFFIDSNDNLCAEFDLGGEFTFIPDSELGWIEIKL